MSYLDDLKEEAWKKVSAPTFREVIDFYHNFGLVGEEKNCVLLTTSFSAGVSLGIISLSGSGKSLISDIFTTYLYPKEDIYTVGSSSKTAIINDYKKINTKRGMYVTELQKLLDSSDLNIELMKTLLENKAFKRPVNMVALGGNIDQIINPLPILFTVATENTHKEYTEEEFCRRGFLYLTTDVSKNLTRKVIKYKLKKRFKKERLKVADKKVSEHVRNHIKFMISNDNKYMYENPFAEYFGNIVPSDYLRIRSILDNYLNIMECSTKWFRNERLFIKDKFVDEKEDEYDGKIFMTVQDIYNGDILYGKMFYDTVLQIPALGRILLAMFDVKGAGAKKKESQSSLVEYEDDIEFSRKMMTIEMLHRELKKEKITLTHTVIKNTCDQLCHGNYLEKEKVGSKWFYIKTFSTEELKTEIDYEKCFDGAYKLMQEHYPELADAWKVSQLTDDKLIVTHPISGKKIDLLKENDTQKQTEEIKEIDIILADIEKGNNKELFLIEKYGENAIDDYEKRSEIYLNKVTRTYGILK